MPAAAADREDDASNRSAPHIIIYAAAAQGSLCIWLCGYGCNSTALTLYCSLLCSTSLAGCASSSSSLSLALSLPSLPLLGLLTPLLLLTYSLGAASPLHTPPLWVLLLCTFSTACCCSSSRLHLLFGSTSSSAQPPPQLSFLLRLHLLLLSVLPSHLHLLLTFLPLLRPLSPFFTTFSVRLGNRQA